MKITITVESIHDYNGVGWAFTLKEEDTVVCIGSADSLCVCIEMALEALIKPQNNACNPPAPMVV